MEYTNTVLIADDSEMILKVLNFLFKKAGYTVLSAINGKNALEFFDGRNIDLVVSDFNMPEMNGPELISEIRAKVSYTYVPVVLFFDENSNERKKIIETSGATVLFDKKNINEKIISTAKKLLV